MGDNILVIATIAILAVYYAIGVILARILADVAIKLTYPFLEEPSPGSVTSLCLYVAVFPSCWINQFGICGMECV